MKNIFPFILACLLALPALAQGHRDREPMGGIDITSLLIGLVVGLIVGYLIGSRMAKK